MNTNKTNNVNKEEMILGAILINDSILPKVSEILSPSLFESVLCRETYLSAVELFKSGSIVDCMTVYMHVRDKENVHVDDNCLKSFFECLMNNVTLAEENEVMNFVMDIKREVS